MIKGKRNQLITYLLDRYTQFLFKIYFRQIKINNHFKPNPSHSILLISNHFSWWDGFFAWFWLRKVAPHKLFNVMMLSEQISRNSILLKAGAFGIEKGTRDTLKGLKYCIQILQNSNNLLLLYPQGRIESQHKYPIVFEKGVLRLVSNENCDIIFLVCLTDYFSKRKPEVTIYSKEYHSVHNNTLHEMENDFNHFYQYCKSIQNSD